MGHTPWKPADDLVHWENKGRVYESPRAGPWAPDVFHDATGDGKFYLYGTDDAPGALRRHGRKQVGVAVVDGRRGTDQPAP